MRSPRWWRQRREEELEAEVQSHLEMAMRDRMERGETAEQARESARREFGNVGLVKEITRDMWGWMSLERLLQDVRYGLRMLLKNPAFALIAVSTLALGIGANTAIFSLLDKVLIRALPDEQPRQLVALVEDANGAPAFFSYPMYDDLRGHTEALAGVVAYSRLIWRAGRKMSVRRSSSNRMARSLQALNRWGSGEQKVVCTVKGDKVVFSVEGKNRSGEPFKNAYTGTIESPTKMTGTVEFPKGPGKWTAVKK
jgi:hypothetical protein